MKNNKRFYKSLLNVCQPIMYILLQHFASESRAVVKAFRDIPDIELYMDSNVYTKIDHFDEYSGKSIMQRVLTKKPNYKGVVGFIQNDNSHGIIYKMIENYSELYLNIKFDNDTCGNFAPWIDCFAETYDGDDLISSDNIINTNDLTSDDNYDNNHVVLLKADLKIEL